MQLSITSWSFNACSLQEAWGIARSIGVNFMDIGLLHGPALNRAAVIAAPLEAADDIRKIGIRVSNLYWLFGDSLEDRALSDPSSRAENLADFRAVLAFASALKCPTIFVLPGVIHPGQIEEEAFAASAGVLVDMMNMAQDHGVVLTVEPHVGGILTDPGMTKAFIDTVPGLKLTLDYAHFACMGHAQAWIDELVPYAAHVHLRQARPGALQAKWAEGTLDFSRIVSTLKRERYEGFLSLEYVHQDYMNTLYDDVLTETIQMRNHITRCLGD